MTEPQVRAEQHRVKHRTRPPDYRRSPPAELFSGVSAVMGAALEQRPEKQRDHQRYQ